MPEASADTTLDLARAHGLDLDPTSVRFNEAGLDYRVAFASDRQGTEWVLRIPRRPDVSSKVADEERILGVVRAHLTVAVPDWRVSAPDLLAYPALPGEPGLTLDENGAPVWHYDPQSPAFAQALGALIADLHRIPADEAETAGVPVQSPDEVREAFRAELARVTDEFDIAPALHERWQARLADPGLWPDRVTMTHGELYPAHLLLDGSDAILSVLDWTTAKVTDPAVDFTYQQMIATPEVFDLTVRAYAEAGGTVPDRLTERCAEVAAAGPLQYALFALETGQPEDREAAAALLMPEGPGH